MSDYSTSARSSANRGIRSLRLLLVGILTAALGLGLASVGFAAPAFATGATGTISGIVTDASDTPIHNIAVLVTSPPTGTSDGDSRLAHSAVFTGVDGSYTVTVPIGTYDVGFYDSANDPIHVDSQVAGVVVLDSQDTIENETLATGGVIDGKVVDRNGDPLSGIVVTSDSENFGVTRTADDGTYSLTGLTYGPHTVYVNTENRNHDIGGPGDSNQYDSTASYAPANFTVPLVTTDSAPLDVDDTTLDAPSSISGLLLGTTGKPVSGVEVDAETIDANGATHEIAANTAPGNDPDHTVETGSSGTFTLGNLPTGKIYLQFVPRDAPAIGKYTVQFLGGSEAIGGSTPVVVTAEGSSIYRQVRLIPEGTINGKVTSKKTGKAVAGVEVTAHPLVPGTTSTVDFVRAYNDDINGTAVTNSSGSFSIAGLPTGSYYVTYNGNDLPAIATLDPASADVYVPANGVVTHNAALDPTTKVSGKITASSSVDGVEVDAYPYNTTTHTVGVDQLGYPRAITYANSDGSYALYLTPGTYIIHVNQGPSSAFAPGYLGGGTSPSDDLTTKLVVGSTALTGENITLSSAPGSINASFVDSNGDDTDQFGDPLLGEATLSRVNTGLGVTESVGNYELDDFPIANIPDGSYQLEITQPPFVSQYSIASTIVTFVMASGQLAEINGNPATGNDLGTIQLNAPTNTQQPAFTVGGNLPSIDMTTGLSIGEMLTAQNGDWTPAPAQFYYQWYRDGAPIAGATNGTYTITAGDVGHKLALGLYLGDPTSSDSLYFDSSPDYITPQTDEVQASVIPDPSVPPAISGVAKVGHTLTASSGTWATPRLNFSYQWIRTVGANPGVVVGGGAAYKPTVADAAPDTQLSVRVSAARVGYETTTSDSSSVDVVPASDLAITKAAKIAHDVGTNSYTVTSPGTWNHSGVTFTYSWQVHDASDNSIITADDTGTSALPDAPAGSRIVLAITAHKLGYADGVYTITVQSGAQVTSAGTPSIDGTPNLGDTLVADLGSITTTPTDATFQFQWYRGTSKITGATTAFHTLGTSDVGKLISVRVTPVDAGYPNGTVVSSPTVTGLGPSTFTTFAPVITGSALVGRLLTASTSDWTPQQTTFSYQWYRMTPASVSSKISGATHPTYTLAAADLGDTIQVTVTGSRSGYANATTTSEPTDAVSTQAITNVTAPTIGTYAQVGTALQATTGTWDVAGTTETYQWYLGGVEVVGATSSTFVPAVSDLGSDVSVAVTATRSGFTSSDPAEAASLTVDLGAATVASKAPTLSVSGKAVTSLKLDTLVSATTGTWPTSTLVISYQWQVNAGAGWVDLTDAATGESVTSKTLFLDPATDPTDFAIGHSFRVEVTGERAGYRTADPIASIGLIAKS